MATTCDLAPRLRILLRLLRQAFDDRYWAMLALALLALGMLACNAGAVVTPTPSPTPLMTPTPIPPSAIPPPSPTPPLPAEWVEALLGLSVREMTIPAAGKSTEARAALVRIDPQRFDIRVLYHPDQPRPVSAWRESSGALVVANGGFFQADHTTAGLIISDGVPTGVSFDQTLDAFAAPGMFSVRDGIPNIHFLAQRAYDPQIDAADDAVQGFPILIGDGGVAGEFALPDRVAWRTVVGRDAKGDVYLINVSRGEVTLLRLRDWLANESGLGLAAALNLDGGPSSGLAIWAGGVNATLDSVSSVPSVIAVVEK